MKLVDKKIMLQSKGVRIDPELEYQLSKRYCTASSDYMSFMLGSMPVGILNGFYTDASPFEIKEVSNNRFVIFENSSEFAEIKFLRRPEFFDKKTKNNIRMEELLKLVAPGFAIIYMHRGCRYVGKLQCKFCVVDKIATAIEKNPEDVAEAVYHGVKEKAITSHVALTCGALAKDRAYSLLGSAVNEIKELVNIPVSVNPEPPENLKSIEKVAEADSIYLNLEIFDEKKRKEILPGKSEISIRHYVKAFKACLEHFSENNVCSVLLAGLESDDSLLKGVEFLASNSIVPVVVPFYPAYHSKLSSLSTPSYNRMKKLYIASAEIIKKYGLDLNKTKAGFVKGGAIFALKEIFNEA